MSLILSKDADFIFRSWSAQNDNNPSIITGGKGVYFWDEKGNKFLDFSSQRVNLNLGHQHPKIIEAIKSQAEKLATCSQVFATEARVEAAELIAQRTPGDLNKVFFTNAGSDAVEHAVRIARIVTNRQKVMTMHKSYHGASAGSLSLTGDPRRWHSEPGIPGVVRFFGPYLYRSSFYSVNEEQECDRAIRHLEELIQYENPSLIAAILIEPIVGSNGVIIPPQGYLAKVREICDRHGILMICDEVMAGFGRTGYWFSVNKWRVCPDIITFAKGVNSGYIPLGGVAISNTVAQYFDDHYFPGGGTYYGHPLACATAVASIKALECENILESTKNLGENLLSPALVQFKEKYSCVGDIRGTGLFWVVELVKNKDSKTPLVPYGRHIKENSVSALSRRCKDLGLSVLTSSNYLFVCPPLIINQSDLKKGLEIIDEALSFTDKHIY